MDKQSNYQVARRFIGYLMDNQIKTPIQLEYRYDMNKKIFQILTLIHGELIEFTEVRFFEALSALLDYLPDDSYLSFSHQVLILKDGQKDVAFLEENLHGYQEHNAQTVMYELSFIYKDISIQTKRYNSFDQAMDELEEKLGDQLTIGVCWFCKYKISYNYFGGTDYRHDQLYCFRDEKHLIKQLTNTSQRNYQWEPILEKSLQNIDALHGCDAFNYLRNRAL